MPNNNVFDYEPYQSFRFFDSPGVCRFNGAVDCSDKELCYHCGWNPAIADARGAKIRERLKRERKKSKKTAL